MADTKKSTTAAKKTTTASKKTGSASNSAKKTGTAKKTTTELHLSAEEKKLITSYRKCSAVEKKIVSTLTEQLGANTGLKMPSLEDILRMFK